MRRAVTFAITGNVWKQTIGPEVPVRKHVEAFKQVVSSGDFGGADSIEIWTSSGRLKRSKNKSAVLNRDIQDDESANAAPNENPDSDIVLDSEGEASDGPKLSSKKNKK